MSQVLHSHFVSSKKTGLKTYYSIKKVFEVVTNAKGKVSENNLY